jgi:dynein light intermediate chain 1
LSLGDPGSGKSTLIHYLKNDPGPQVIQNENDDAPTAAHNNNFGINSNYNTSNIPVDNIDDSATNTLALGYSFIDVQDEENEGNV